MRISKKQLQANATHKGGFLSLLAGLAAKVLPTVAKGVAASLATNAIKRIVLPSDDSKKRRKKKMMEMDFICKNQDIVLKLNPFVEMAFT